MWSLVFLIKTLNMDIKQFYLDNYFSENISYRDKELWFETNEQARKSVEIMQKLYDDVIIKIQN